MKSWIIVGLFLSGITGCGEGITQPPASQRFEQQATEWAQVERVHDGDTLWITQNGEREKIRLCGIDAPELDQPLGTASRDNLATLLAQSSTGEVGIVPVEQDQYGRLVAEVFVPMAGDLEIHINSQMVADGMAYVYGRYVGGCPNGAVMERAEADPKAAGVGVWEEGMVPPWEYRQQ